MDLRAGDAFIESTKYRNLEPSDQKKGVTQPPLHTLLRDGTRIDLPAPTATGGGNMSLRSAIDLRRSLRSYADKPFTQDELSWLLWSTQGVKPESTDKHTLRTVPSAGARHALETVLLVNRVEGMVAGLYQYDAANHALVQWESQADIVEQIKTACLNQSMLETCAVTFIWVAERARMAWRYGERGIRYLHLDAGHVCQNLHLAAESIGSGACAIGAFGDDELNALLGLDGVNRFAIYLASVGKREA